MRERIMKLRRQDSGAGTGGLRAKAKAAVEAAERNEKSKDMQSRLRCNLIKEGVLPTQEMEGVIEDLSREAEPRKSPHKKKLAEMIVKEKQRQDEFRKKLNEELKNDPEMQNLISDMNARIEQVTMQDVIELIRVMKERYGHKLK